MKSIAAGICLAILSTTAMAGGLETPVIEAPVIIQDATASSAPSAQLVLALTTMIVFGAALSH